MWENLVWSLGQEDPLEKEMATHSSIIIYRLEDDWRKRPGEKAKALNKGSTDTQAGLQPPSLGPQQVWKHGGHVHAAWGPTEPGIPGAGSALPSYVIYVCPFSRKC